MVFCDMQICNAKASEKVKQCVERRETAKSGDKDKYREVCL